MICPFCVSGTVAKIETVRVDEKTRKCPQCGRHFRRRRSGKVYCLEQQALPPFSALPVAKELQKLGLWG